MEKSVKGRLLMAGGALALTAGLAGGITLAAGNQTTGTSASPGAVRAQRVDVPLDTGLSPSATPDVPGQHAITVRVKNQSHFTGHVCVRGGAQPDACTGDIAPGAGPVQATSVFDPKVKEALALGFVNDSTAAEGTREQVSELQPVTGDATYCFVMQNGGEAFTFNPTSCDGF